MGLLYLYGIVRESHELPTTLSTRLQVVSMGGLGALVEVVDDAGFAPGVLDEKLQSLEWVAAQAHVHQAVLDQVMSVGAVVPARLCTIFSGVAALQVRLHEQGPRFRALLDTIEGRQEWSVKVYCQRASLEPVIAAREGLDRPAQPSGTPGRDFLIRKRRRAVLVRLVDEAIDGCVDDVLDSIHALAAESRLRSLLSEQTTQRADEMMLNAAVLLDPEVEQRLVDALDETSELHGDCFSIVLSGPWPAYSFCDEAQAPVELEQGAPRAELR